MATPSFSKRFLTTLTTPITQARGSGADARRGSEAPPPMVVSEPFNVGMNRGAVDRLLEHSRSPLAVDDNVSRSLACACRC